MCGMRDQEIEFACLAEEGDALRPMRLRYGVTRNEATHHEPLEVGLAQEDAEVPADDDATWADVETERQPVESTRSSCLPDEVDEMLVATAAESDAMHIVGS